jgi:hypothetical protein
MRVLIKTHLPPVQETYEMLGVAVECILQKTKIVIGTIDPSKLDLLRKHPDIQAIEEDKSVSIL